MKEFQIALIMFETDHIELTSKPIKTLIFDTLESYPEALKHFQVLEKAIKKGITK